MKMVGPAANVEHADKILSQLQNRTSHRQAIRIENHKQDSIGSIIGGNSYTTETTKYNFGKALYDTFFGKSSPHNCYGVGNYQCIKDGYRTDQIMHAESTILELNSKIKGK